MKIKQLFSNKRIQTKMTKAFIVTALVPMLVLVFYAYWFVQSSTLSRVKADVSESVHQICLKIDYQLQNYEQILQYIMYNSQVASFFEATDLSYYDIYNGVENVFMPMLLSIQEMNKEIADVGVYTNNPLIRPRKGSILSLDELPEGLQAQEGAQAYHIRWQLQENGQLCGFGKLMTMHRRAPTSIAYVAIPSQELFPSALKMCSNTAFSFWTSISCCIPFSRRLFPHPHGRSSRM